MREKLRFRHRLPGRFAGGNFFVGQATGFKYAPNLFEQKRRVSLTRRKVFRFQIGIVGQDLGLAHAGKQFQHVPHRVAQPPHHRLPVANLEIAGDARMRQ